MWKIIYKVKQRFSRNSVIYRICKDIYVKIVNIVSIHGYIRQYLVFPFEAFCRRNHIKPFYDNNAKILESLKNKHYGKRCFIIATGPSLRIEDVEMLNGELAIGVNSLYKLFDKTKYRPDYYLVLDEDVQKSVEQNLDKYNSLCKEYVFMNLLRKVKDERVMYIPCCYQDHWFNLGNNKYDYVKNLKYSDDLLWGLYDKYTITIAAIELAIYMGCKEVYLIGVDCNYTGPTVHFDESDNSPRIPYDIAYHTQKAMITGYRFMEKETKKRGIHVYNATRGGMLEEFDRVDFDSLFNKNGGQKK